MKIQLVAIGKTDNSHIKALIEIYKKRLKHYVNFDFLTIPDVKNTKNLDETKQKEKEGLLILKNLKPGAVLILLDEKGKEHTSVEFSKFIQKKMNSGIKQLVFVIGGPFGFSSEVYGKAQGKLALSKMTFSHQMIRIFAVEQIYRAFTILKNEPYHHK